MSRPSSTSTSSRQRTKTIRAIRAIRATLRLRYIPCTPPSTLALALILILTLNHGTNTDPNSILNPTLSGSFRQDPYGGSTATKPCCIYTNRTSTTLFVDSSGEHYSQLEQANEEPIPMATIKNVS